MMKKQQFFLSAIAMMFLIAESAAETLDEIVVQGENFNGKSRVVALDGKISELQINESQLKQRGITLGEALSKELGIHSSQFGSGASAPVIRGQTGKRIKVLQNNGENFDMSAMSPDHAIAVDSMLARHIEVLRGVNTLLYTSGNMAGVVNVVDNKIPVAVPEDGIDGQAGVRLGSNDKERLGYAGISLKLHDHLVLRLQGMGNKAADYRTPSYRYTETREWGKGDEEGKNGCIYQNYEGICRRTSERNKIHNSQAQSSVGSVGLSWIGEQGYLGVAYTERKDRYGLVEHSHTYDVFRGRVLRESQKLANRFLRFYPFLADSSQIDYDNPGLITRTDTDTSSNHSHKVDLSQYPVPSNAFIDMRYRRVDVEGVWKQPVAGIETLKLTFNRANYRHQEQDGEQVENFFKTHGHNVRFELAHTPWKGLSGAVGVQWMSQLASATNPEENHNTISRQRLLNEQKTRQISLFAVEQLDLGKWVVDFGARLEKQKIAMEYDMDKFRAGINRLKGSALPDLSPHRATAFSYGTGINWYFLDNHKLSLNVSHQERVPNAQELYTFGKHLATESFEVGNKHLRTEKSNNVELSLAYAGDKWDYKFNLFYSRFKNYIFLNTLNAERGPRSFSDLLPLKFNHYEESEAIFKGIEGEIGYQLSPTYHVAVFGDYVYGQLINLPDEIKTKPGTFGWRAQYINVEQADRPVPKMPPLRLGLRMNAQWNANWSGEVEYLHTFSQNRVSKFEKPTKGFPLVNATLNYQNQWGSTDYKFFVKVDNLLNRRTYQHTSFLSHIPQKGRNILVGSEIRF